jgi:hypothetical protein
MKPTPTKYCSDKRKKWKPAGSVYRVRTGTWRRSLLILFLSAVLSGLLLPAATAGATGHRKMERPTVSRAELLGFIEQLIASGRLQEAQQLVEHSCAEKGDANC